MFSKEQIIKWKANSEKICDFSVEQGTSLYSPKEDPNTGTLYIISSSGELFTFNEGSSDSHSVFTLEPSSICFDSNSYFYLGDYLSSSILYKNSSKYNPYTNPNIILYNTLYIQSTTSTQQSTKF